MKISVGQLPITASAIVPSARLSVILGGLLAAAVLALLPASAGLAAGSVSFGASAYFAASSDATWVAMGELNGDGKPDLVVANRNSSTISVLLGDGAGVLRRED